MAPKVQTLNLPSLKGNSPVRGNVCEADKRVPVSGGKGVTRRVTGGLCPFFGEKGGPLAVEGFNPSVLPDRHPKGDGRVFQLHKAEIKLLDFFNACISGVTGTASIVKG